MSLTSVIDLSQQAVKSEMPGLGYLVEIELNVTQLSASISNKMLPAAPAHVDNLKRQTAQALDALDSEGTASGSRAFAQSLLPQLNNLWSASSAYLAQNNPRAHVRVNGAGGALPDCRQVLDLVKDEKNRRHQSLEHALVDISQQAGDARTRVSIMVAAAVALGLLAFSWCISRLLPRRMATAAIG